MPGVGGDLGDVVVERVRDRHPARVALGEGVPGLDRGRVGVDPDQQQSGDRVEEGPGVARPAERGVDEDRRAAAGRGAGERGQQEGGDTAGHHRHVRVGVLAHVTPPLALHCCRFSRVRRPAAAAMAAVLARPAAGLACGRCRPPVRCGPSWRLPGRRSASGGGGPGVPRPRVTFAWHRGSGASLLARVRLPDPPDSRWSAGRLPATGQRIPGSTSSAASENESSWAAR